MTKSIFAGWALLLLLCGTPTLPLQAKRYLFLEWHHADSTIVLGHFKSDLVHRVAERKILLAQLSSKDIQDWLGEKGSSAALLYFHCMWGQEKHFQRQCLRSIDGALNSQPDTGGIQTVIAVIWHAGGLHYVKNWNRAAAKGEALGPVLGWIGAQYPHRLHVLAHSMGNRFLEGTLRTKPHSDAPFFNSMVLFSPDLDAAAGDADLARLTQETRRMTIFLHRHDRVLLLSGWKPGTKRLGRWGLADKPSPELAGKLHIIDMTGHIRGIQNHAHLRKKWARQRLAECWRS